METSDGSREQAAGMGAKMWTQQRQVAGGSLDTKAMSIPGIKD